MTATVLAATLLLAQTFADVTKPAGLASYTHHNAAYGAKFLPETMGPGCAFLDYDNDGWLDILLLDGQPWPTKPAASNHSSIRLYRNTGKGGFIETTKAAGLDTKFYAMGVATADYDNDGFTDLYITAVGQNRLYRNTGQGTFADVTQKAAIDKREAFSTSALWFDFDRDGHLDLYVANYVRWSAKNDVYCSLDGKTKSYCTPEAYRGSTSWLFRNRGNGTFEDVTGKSGLFDTSSKSLGVAMLDFDNDGWPDLFVANDTQPNKLYRNNRDGTFRETAVSMGVAFSEDGRARAGMGVDAGDFLNNGKPGIAVTNFDNEKLGLYQLGTTFTDVAMPSGIGVATRSTLGFACFFADFDNDGWLDLLAVNGHIDDSVRNLGKGVQYAQPTQLFRNLTNGKFRDVATAPLSSPKIGRGAAYGDFDNDGDLDLLITTNGGPAYLYRNDAPKQNGSIRLQLEGRVTGKSNRDAIGARVRLADTGQTQMVKSGSSYLSASEKALTFGLGTKTQASRIIVQWPSGATQEFSNLAAGRTYRLTEGEALPKSSPR
ncbi:RNA-binding protein [Bryobacterales bacterium F-183]|nr:RNA-binding protein [Bryobacterales bacterium F-183]